MATTIRQLQLALLIVAKEFIRVCDKYNLTYIADGGTCLGAVRHAGFIPWDDDIDFALPRDEYQRFLEVCRKGALKKGFTLQEYGPSEPFYACPFVRIRLDNSLCEIPYHKELNWNHLGIFVDVFPFDYVNTSDYRIIHRQKKIIDFVNRLLAAKLAKTNPTIRSKLGKVLVSGFSVERLMAVREKCYSKLTNKNGNNACIVDFNSPYSLKKAIIHNDIFLDRIEVSFEDILVKIPRDYDAFLTTIYGDYMQLPPPDKRKAHEPATIVVPDWFSPVE